MYGVSVRQRFISRHYLPFEAGKESTPHSHHYTVEVCTFGKTLDAKGFLIDIVDLQRNLDGLALDLEGRLLNELIEFKGKTPSLENLAYMFWEKIRSSVKDFSLERIRVTIWEEEGPSASYEGDAVM
jgi:6-pyruvoyltetrahydropterin/6-carboxytetrahydropterin synthase